MTSPINGNVNSAIIAGQFGLQQASNGITDAAVGIAQNTALRNAQSTLDAGGSNAVLADAAVNSLSTVRQTLPSAASGITSDLVSLQVNSINAQASAKVLDTAFDTVGTIIDTLA